MTETGKMFHCKILLEEAEINTSINVSSLTDMDRKDITADVFNIIKRKQNMVP